MTGQRFIKLSTRRPRSRVSHPGRHSADGTTCPGRCGPRRPCAHLAAGATAAGALAGQTPLTHRPCVHGPACFALAAGLRVRRRTLLQRRRRTGRNPAASPRGVQAAERRSQRASRAQHRVDPARTRADPRSAVHQHLSGALPVQPLSATASGYRCLRATQRRRVGRRPGRPAVHRPDRVLRCQRLRARLLQALHRRRQRSRRGPGAGAGQLPPSGGGQRGRTLSHLGPAGGELPHERYRSRHAGRAPGALPHTPACAGALLGRLPRLVGRRAARAWQSHDPRPHVYAQGDGCRHLARAAQAARHRLRAGEPPAGLAPQPCGAGRQRPGGQQPPGALRPRCLHRMAAAAAPGVQRSRHRADLRRSLHGVSPGSGRCAGVLRCTRRSRHLRQDARWRPAGGRGLWAGKLDETLSRGAAGRHLLRPRHLQLAPLRATTGCCSSTCASRGWA